MWAKIKQYTIAFFVGLGSIIGLVLMFKKNNEAEILLGKDEELEKQDNKINAEIKDIKTKLDNVEETDLTPDEVIDYWDKE